MPTDTEMSRTASSRPIAELVKDLGLEPSQWLPYGHDIAKVDPGVLREQRRREGEAKLILVSAITPTPAGEGKTTTSIGLAQALCRLGHYTCLALREPSLGP